MSRFVMLSAIGLAALISFGLYIVEQEVERLEERMRGLSRDLVESRHAVHVMRAEWSFLSRPDRLQSLAGRHLQLIPIDPTRVGGLSDLPLKVEGGPASMPASPVLSPAGDAGAYRASAGPAP